MQIANDKSLNKKWGLRLAPTLFTVAALAAGIHALRFLFIGEYIKAATFILIAAFLDGMDGRVARFLKTSSSFGGSLDMIADFLNFGVVPAFLIYFKYLNYPKIPLGWAAAIFYITCTAWRLARFSVIGMEEGDYFKGVPAPGGAFIVLLAFGFENAIEKFQYIEYLNVFLLILCGVLMVSNIKTISLSRLNLPKRYLGPILCVFCALFGLLFMHPWGTLFCFQLAYVGSVIFLFWSM